MSRIFNSFVCSYDKYSNTLESISQAELHQTNLRGSLNDEPRADEPMSPITRSHGSARVL